MSSLVRLWVGIFFSPREWLWTPRVIYQHHDLFFDFLFLRSHLSWRNFV